VNASLDLRALRGLLFVLMAAFIVACDADSESPPDPGAPSNVPAAKDLSAPDIPEDAPLVAFLGDSLAAGLHLSKAEAFPAVLQRRLARRARPFRLVNAGVSGSTTAAGLSRVDWILDQNPDVVVVELGANDGFRGIPVETVEENLRGIIARIRERGAKPLLLGIRLPPNYGTGYATAFDAVYGKVAKAMDIPFVESFMAGVGGQPEMNLPDGIHPTPEGHERLAENMEKALSDLLSDL